MKRCLRKTIIIICIFIIIINACSCDFNKKNDLVIWSHFGDKETAEIRKIADKWGKQNGVHVKVLSDRGDTRAYLQAEKHDMGPDIEFGISYTKLKILSKNKLVAPIPSNIDTTKYMDTALNTVKYNGQAIALPINISTYALYYNTKMISEPPKTLDELIELGKKYGFEFDINDIYLNFSFIYSQGGYIYKYNNGEYDTNEIGINSTDTIKGYEFLQDMVKKYKIMPEDIDGIKARNDFIDGKTAFFLSGPNDIDTIDKGNVHYSISVLPKQLPTFVNVSCGIVSNNSNKKEKAFKLLDYLIEKVQMPLYRINGQIPVTNTACNNKEIANDSKLKVFMQQAKENGISIPDSEHTESFQSSRTIFKDLTNGNIAPDKCGKELLTDLNKSLKKIKD